MSDVVIRVEELSKRYCVGVREPYKALRDSISHGVEGLFRFLTSGFNGRDREINKSLDSDIWALKEVSFEVKRGQVMGVIGRNGAGKSTLLKILSRITDPTEGCVKIRGRISSLLEVGTGFHRELTGRENIYLNGAILGMRRAEINRRFDEIVNFGEIGEFLDTPVKHYSSGMYMRLAFAIAAHLEPEILLVDEVLAVGDAAFQNKCLGKMEDVANEGRTVLFVSHNMAAILALCHKAILLDSGRVIKDGATKEVVDDYLDGLEQAGAESLAERTDRKGNQSVKFLKFRLTNRVGAPIQRVVSGQEVNLVFEYKTKMDMHLRKVQVAIGVHGMFDERLFYLSTNLNGRDFAEIPSAGTLACNIPCLSLQPGRYNLTLSCRVGGEIADWIQHAGVVEVEAGDFFGSGKLPPSDQGRFLMKHSWAIVPSDNPSKRDPNRESSQS